MRVYEIENLIVGGSVLVVNAFDDVVEILDNAEIGDAYQINITEMEEEEFNKLEDWDGF